MENNRKDLRHLGFITIDSSETKDIDDAVYIEKTIEGWRLYVAIADVSHFVKHNSKLDLEAREKATTIYLLGDTKHMFPDSLSQGYCSLSKQSDKMVAVCEMEFDLNGKRTNYKFYKGIINSKDEVNYDRVNRLLKFKEKYTSYDQSYNLQEILTQGLQLSKKIRNLREKNQKNKSEFNSEPKYILNDDNNQIIKIVKHDRGKSEKMIEDFMISTNLCAGDYIFKKTKNGIVRKHKKLDDQNYQNICDKVSRRYDFDVTKEDVLNDFKRFNDNPMVNNFRDILIEEYTHAVYTHDMNDNFHEGLTVKNYSHYTSPIRRYADILTHRLIFGELESLEELYFETIKVTIDPQTQEEVKNSIKTPITKYISEKAIEAKKMEKKHLRNMLNDYYLRCWTKKTRVATLQNDFFKNKISTNQFGNEEVKEVYCGSFLNFYEGDSIMIKIPKGLRIPGYKFNVTYEKDEKWSKIKNTDVYNWQLVPKKKF